MDNLHAVQTVFLFLLLVVAVFAAIAVKLKLPSSIVLVLAGLAISFIPHVPRIQLNPDLIFLLFLPPLLYAAAWQTNWREFRRNLVSLVMLAVGLVAFTVFGVAFFADRFIPALDWKSGFLLGAVVATTDAIAATSIARSIGLPTRITDMLEAESLLNDATGLLALEFGLRMLVQGETPTVTAGLLRLLWLVAGGLGAGLLVGLFTAWVERFIDDGPLEMVTSVIVPYVAYLAAEEIKASGVLAVVACGLYLSRKSAGYLSPAARIQVWGAWGALDFALNGIVFVLIGLQLPYVMGGQQYSHLTLLLYGAGLSGILIALRMAWMFPGAWVAWLIRTRILKQHYPAPEAKGIFVMGWTGMRGVLALAAAISLPELLGNGRPFAQRNLIIFLTFSVILVTLVLQGLTLPALIRALGLAGTGSNDHEELEARRELLGAALTHLQAESIAAQGTGMEHSYEDLIHKYEHRYEAVCDSCHASPEESKAAIKRIHHVSEITLSAAQAERRALLKLRDEERIGDDLMRRLERELDLVEAGMSGT